MNKKAVKYFAIASVVIVIAVLLLVFRKNLFGDTREKLFNLLHHNKNVTVKGDSVALNSSELLEKYFNYFGYEAKWTKADSVQNAYRDMLIEMLNQADSLGLNRADYHEDYLKKYDSLSHLPNFDMSEFESENELIFTDAALSFLYHVAYGKEIPRIEYNGVKYNIDSSHIMNVFNDLMVHHDWRETLDSIEPRTAQYLLLKSELNRMQSFVRNYSSIDSINISANDSGRMAALIKLKAYNFITDTLRYDSVSKPQFKSAIVSFQKMMGMDTTGTLDAKTITELSYPIANRLAQIKESLNYWRWTGRLREKEFILVNIPAARLQIVTRDTIKDMTMRVIVGKVDTKTPSFTAYITRVIAYPYWTVPISIATKEMLPKIRKRISYLDDNNLQVINNKGMEVNPQQVDWNRYSEKYFPYTIRQSTGCDNSLGVLKFDLNSPFSIYLHDTNHRDLFGKKERFMSHGCVRVEKPMELAGYILDKGLDSSTVVRLQQCMKDQKPQDFVLKKRFAVLILYMTADVDENMNVKFYKDIYAEENKKAL